MLDGLSVEAVLLLLCAGEEAFVVVEREVEIITGIAEDILQVIAECLSNIVAEWLGNIGAFAQHTLDLVLLVRYEVQHISGIVLGQAVVGIFVDNGAGGLRSSEGGHAAYDEGVSLPDSFHYLRNI